MVDIVNAAPMIIDLGTKDSSIRSTPIPSPEIPQHVPKVYLFAERGPIGETFVDLNMISLPKLYGENTFNKDKKYFTHQTLIAQAVASAGNNLVVHRLVPPDAKDKANLALYLDVLPTQVPLYEKFSDGSLKLDTNGNPIPVLDSNGNPVLVNGYKVAWVLDKTAANIGQYQPGLLTQRFGIQTDGTVQSVQYPIFEFWAMDFGEFGNRIGIRLYPAQKTDQIPFPDTMFTKGKLYPYYFELLHLEDEVTGKIVTVYNSSIGTKYIKFGLKDKGIDPTSGAVIDLPEMVDLFYIKSPTSLTNGIGGVHVYYNNLETVLQMLYDSEKIISDPYRDSLINNTENNIYALNILTFTSSNGSPYQSIKLVDITGSTRITRNTNLFFSGSSDGTISLQLLDTLVKVDMERYAEPLDEYQDMVLHPATCVYDSGFTLETKKSLFNMISLRKDTYVFLSTYAHDANSPYLIDQYSTGVALKTYGELFPESGYFGTPVMRYSIWIGSGKLVNNLYTERVPATYEVAYKVARLAGANTGQWNMNYLFDKAPNSIITQLKDIDITWLPAIARNTLWAAGINFILKYDHRHFFFPAAKTAYENDTSVLNSIFTMMAISYLHRVLNAAWREFTGTISYTNNQLIERINNFILAKVKDKFGNLFVIIPETYITEQDVLRGYSITVKVNIYANNMKTVHVSYVESFRMEDLEQQP